MATAAKAAYQMLIAVNLTQDTYRMLEFERYPVYKPQDSGAFHKLIEFELATVHPDYQQEFIQKFAREPLMRRFSAGDRIVTMKVPHKGTDGEYHWNFTQVVCAESPYTDDMIEITLSRNIDEERQLEEAALDKERRTKQILEDALQKAENANRAKSDFLSKMSHDICTPLNAIIGMTELAQLHVEDAKKLGDYLQKIASSGSHLLELVNEVLDVSKIESGTTQLAEIDFNLQDLLRDVIELVGLTVQNRQQKLQIDVDYCLHAQVYGDAVKLKQILVNILDNASKYTEPGGRITFRVVELKKAEPAVGTYRFIIEDTGIGMMPEYVQHIFEPFSRAADSRTSAITGTGLGMTIVKNLVELMSGDIQVESEYGVGSAFIVTLCLTKRDFTQMAPSPNPASLDLTETAFSKLRVLLAEDNDLNLQIAQEMLEMLGARVETARNGRQAVDAICSH